MKSILHFVMPVVAGILFPLYGAAQAAGSEEWTAMINSLSGKQAISAQAASFQKFGSYSVSQATGIPNVSIPIYTIKSGDLEFPITLSYHMGGIKVEEIPSWVGLGWNLSAGGVINRVIRGNPDESGWCQVTTRPNYPKYPNPLIKDDGISTDRYSGYYDDYTELLGSRGFENAIQYYSYLSHYNDKASDIYTYSINGISGKFVYDFDRNIVQIPYTDNKIERSSTNDFTITDDKGNRYIFRASDTEYGEGPAWNKPWVPVSWLLSEIVSADGKDSIKFTYGQPVTYETTTCRRTVIWGQYWDNTLAPRSESTYATNTSTSGQRTQEKLLTSIEFRGGRVDLTAAGQRLDMRNHSLSQVQIKDAAGVVIKRAEFSYDYFSNGNAKYQKRLKLLGVKIYGRTGSVPESYKFTYNAISLPSYCQTGSSDRGYMGQDYWGYYTGRNYNTNMFPTGLLSQTNLSAEADRNSNESSMRACVLNRIDYPTGGYTVFETEANRAKVNGVGTEKPVGGLRIASIKSYTSDSDANPLVVTYSYEDGKLVYFPDMSLYKTDISFSAANKPGAPSRGGAPFQPAYDYPMAPGVIFTEDPISPLGYYQGSPVVYGKVTETQGGSAAPAGKTVYEFNGPSIFRRSMSGYNTGMPHDGAATPVEWQSGHLKKMTVYRRENDGTDVKIKEVEHSYTGLAKEVCHGVMVFDRVVYQGIVSEIGITPGSIGDTGRYASQYYYHYWTTEMTGWYKLESTTEREFSSADDITGTGTTATYTYGNTNRTGQQKNYLPSRVATKDLQGGLLQQKDYTYAHQAGTTAAAMYSKNMLNYPYEETVTGRDGNVVFRSRIVYDSSILKPYMVYKSYSSTLSTTDPELTIVKYDAYDNVEVTKDRAGVSTVRLWSYKGQYPVVEIVNATYQQVADALERGGLSMNLLLNATQPTAAQFAKLNALRSNTTLSGALITTWEFAPLIGVTKITDPSGRETIYTYDPSNRLSQISEIKDGISKPIQKFEYHLNPTN